MRLFLVRRTRSFILENYAAYDPERDRKFLTFSDGRRVYFPVREPRTLKFVVNDADPTDEYAALYSDAVVAVINALNLPRYGLKGYLEPKPAIGATAEEDRVIADLSKAGKRLMGFCRVGLFKRLESSGWAFFQSVQRHILRNHIFLHAIEQGLPLPIGGQGAEFLDSRLFDEDADGTTQTELIDDDAAEGDQADDGLAFLYAEEHFRQRAAQVYARYAGPLRGRFRWIAPGFFRAKLATELRADAGALRSILARARQWIPSQDNKLQELLRLVRDRHPGEKILLFSQFADTVRYLQRCLSDAGIVSVAAATGDSSDPTALAWRFSPGSNQRRATVAPADELRVLLATDVLSEGQNLQDSAIVVNYDLPWAIIRLIQRAGRVDRIGQQAPTVFCYSFLPADGVEKIIRLRGRVRQRLHENAEVVGSDETFFEDEAAPETLRQLYHENAGILDGSDDGEVDLASLAYEIWHQATKDNPELEKTIKKLAELSVLYSAKTHPPAADAPEGVLVYLKTAEGNDVLGWIDREGLNISESQLKVLRAAACAPDTPAVARDPRHHEIVRAGVERLVREVKSIGGSLGRPSGARFKIYERLKLFTRESPLFETQELKLTLEQIYRHPLRAAATDIINKRLRDGASDEELASLVVSLRQEDRLSVVHEEDQEGEPQIVCSLGLRAPGV